MLLQIVRVVVEHLDEASHGRPRVFLQVGDHLGAERFVSEGLVRQEVVPIQRRRVRRGDGVRHPADVLRLTAVVLHPTFIIDALGVGAVVAVGKNHDGIGIAVRHGSDGHAVAVHGFVQCQDGARRIVGDIRRDVDDGHIVVEVQKMIVLHTSFVRCEYNGIERRQEGIRREGRRHCDVRDMILVEGVGRRRHAGVDQLIPVKTDLHFATGASLYAACTRRRDGRPPFLRRGRSGVDYDACGIEFRTRLLQGGEFQP